MRKIILASSSPRRKMLLEQICVPFEIIESEIEENISLENSPYEGVKTLATQKARNVSEKINYESVIIGADTMIAFRGELLGKPGDNLVALENLKRLQGNKHTVYTGVCVIVKDNDGNSSEYTLVDYADVYMRKMSDEELITFINTKEYCDKAGGYAIQGKGALMIDKIDGDYNTVVGLPLTKLYLLLKKIGIDIAKYWNE